MSALSERIKDEDFKTTKTGEDVEISISPLEFVSLSKHASITSVFKRGLDITIASIALIFTLPIFLLISLAVKLEDGGEVIFDQSRIGVGGKDFQCLKFRTMMVNAEAHLEEVLRTDPRARAEWERTRKLTVDPRITRTGNFLRTTSLDELPQLINVLKGEMSLVGPRPIVKAEIDLYKGDYKSYKAVRPGITGLWQVSGRSDVNFDERVQLDKKYVSDWSIWSDMAIMLRTIPAILGQSGAR